MNGFLRKVGMFSLGAAAASLLMTGCATRPAANQPISSSAGGGSKEMLAPITRGTPIGPHRR